MNDFAEPEVRYLVEVRCPKAGERYLWGAKISTAETDMRLTQYPVIVEVQRPSRKQVAS